MGDQHGGDHLDFRGAEISGPVAGKVVYQQYGAAPTALDALPPRVAGFTGRGSELGRLLNAFDPSVVGGPEAVLVAAVSGLGGIGKTALAVEAAHAACGKSWFPGGVLFVNLHGYDDDHVTADQALEALLRALGTEPEHIPNGSDERAALYRSVLAERGAVLILADNASSSEQVRPLLPGGTRHRLLVTSRNKLPQLGARLLPLDELSPEGAYDLLSALRKASRSEEAIEAYDNALGIFREFEDWYDEGLTLHNLALAHEEAHRPAEARTAYFRAADAYTQANAPTEAAQCRTWADDLTP